MKQSSKKHELGTAALYCRLSRDDNMDSESNSIQNQRKILQKAAKDKGYTDTIFFVDDGITGTTMKRPGFQKMLTAIEAGYISAVFVKDLSRLGRNYIEVGKLTEEFFPLHDIRLVAVSDGVDSDEGEFLEVLVELGGSDDIRGDNGILMVMQQQNCQRCHQNHADEQQHAPQQPPQPSVQRRMRLISLHARLRFPRGSCSVCSPAFF